MRAARAVTDILVSVLFGAAASGGFLPCGVRQSCQPPLAVLSDLSHCEAGGSVMPKYAQPRSFSLTCIHSSSLTLCLQVSLSSAR